MYYAAAQQVPNLKPVLKCGHVIFPPDRVTTYRVVLNDDVDVWNIVEKYGQLIDL
jgi:hypothetical protein